MPFTARATFYVIYAEPNAIAIAEIKLSEIAVQVLLAAMLIDALHAALEDRIVVLDGIGADDALALIAHIFIIAVLDGIVAREPPAYVVIMARFVGHQRAFAGDVLAHDVMNLTRAARHAVRG